MADALIREMLDTMFVELKKAGKKVPDDAAPAAATQLNGLRAQARNQAIGLLFFTYRNVSDDDLSAYIKLLDSDSGRWGTELLLNAVRPVLASRFGAFGKDLARIALSQAHQPNGESPGAAGPRASGQGEARGTRREAADRGAPAAAPPSRSGISGRPASRTCIRATTT